MAQINIKQLFAQKYNNIKILLKDGIKEVSLLENKENKQKIIMKEIDISKLNEKEKEMSEQEGKILLKLKHPNIVKCYGFYYEKDKIIILIEYIEGGDLFNKIENQKNKNKYFKEEEIIDWFIEICEGIKYIHSNNIIHRDLKPQNIFFNKDNHIKIGDFGISKQLINTNKANTRLGSENYVSPEIISNQSYDYRIDIWNLGIILYELTQLKHPFEDNKISIEKKINNILKGEFFNFSNKNYSPKLLNLIENLLKVNPNERKNIDEILLICYTIKITKNSNSKNE
jgi:NIMA (never in mitosis gene a)-related kinase